MTEDAHDLYPKYARYMADAAADLESTKGAVSVENQECHGVKYLDPASFREFWRRVCRDAALKQRWLRRLEFGFVHQKQAVVDRIDEFFGISSEDKEDAAA